MSKFCQNCGKQLDDAAVFCPSCGTKSELPAAAPAPQAPGYTLPAPEVPTYNVPPAPEVPVYTAPQAPAYGAPAYAAPGAYAAPAPRSNNKLIIGIIAALLVVAVAAVLLIVFLGGGGGSYSSALDKALALYEGNYDQVEDMLPPECWDYIEDYENTSKAEYLYQVEDRFERQRINLEEEYGEEYTVSYDLTEEKELSEPKLERAAEYLEKTFYIPAESVTEGYELEVDLTIEGSKGEKTDEEEMIALKIDGAWYLVRMYESNGSLKVGFPI